MQNRMALVSRQRNEFNGEELIVAKHYWEIRPRGLRYFFIMIQNFQIWDDALKEMITSLGFEKLNIEEEYWIEVAGIKITKKQEQEFWSTPKKMQWCRKFIAYALGKSRKAKKKTF